MATAAAWGRLTPHERVSRNYTNAKEQFFANGGGGGISGRRFTRAPGLGLGRHDLEQVDRRLFIAKNGRQAAIRGPGRTEAETGGQRI